MTLLDRRRAQSERELRRLIRESGEPTPSDEEIAEVADFFARSGPNALPMIRRAFEEMIAAKRRGEDLVGRTLRGEPPRETDARPPEDMR